MSLRLSFQQALERSDTAWVLHQLALLPADAVGLDPTSVQFLLAQPDPLLRHAALLHIQRCLEDPPVPLREIAALLPRTLTGLWPESQALLAELCLRLPLSQLLDWRGEALLPGVTVAWHSAALVHDPALLASAPRDEGLRQAVRRIPVGVLPRPRRVLAALLQHADDAVVRHGLAGLVPCLRSGRLLAEEALALLRPLLAVPGQGGARPLLAEALTLLHQPWSSALACPQRELMALLRAGALVPVAAQREVARALAAWSQRDALREILEDEARDPYLRREALGHLGALGQGAEVSALLRCACADPPFFAPAALLALQQLRRRGFSCAAEEVSQVLALSLRVTSAGLGLALCLTQREPPPEPATLVAEVLASHWTQICDAPLVAEDADAPRWIELLAALGTRAASARLQALLADPAARCLRSALIEALGRCACQEAEAAILALLDEEPEAAWAALRRIGGALTVAMLEQRLQALPPTQQRQALGLLIHLAPDVTPLLPFLAQDPAALELLAALPSRPAPAAQELLLRVVAHAGHPARLAALRALGSWGGAAELPVLAATLLEAEEDVIAAAHSAIRAVGQRLHQRGALRPLCVQQARTAEEAAAFVLAECILVELAHPERSASEQERLLGQLVPLAHPELARRLRPFLRRTTPALRKRLLECLGQHGGAEAAGWLAPFLRGDIYVRRQALTALGQLGATWAAEDIAQSLSHSNMNIKKAAAVALQRAGRRAVVPALLGWLRGHDNPGLREELQRALRAIVGADLVPVLLEALAQTAAPRHHELLLRALDQELEVDAVVQGVAAQAAWAPRLLQLLFAGAITLRAPGTLAGLVRALRACELPVTLSLEPAATPARERARQRQGQAQLRATLEAASTEEVAPLLRAALPTLSEISASGAAGEVDPALVRALARHAAPLLGLLAAAVPGSQEARSWLALCQGILPALSALQRAHLAQHLRGAEPGELRGIELLLSAAGHDAAALLPACAVQLSTAAARRALLARSPAVRAHALPVVLLDADGEPWPLLQGDPVAAQRALQALLEHGVPLSLAREQAQRVGVLDRLPHLLAALRGEEAALALWRASDPAPDGAVLRRAVVSWLASSVESAAGDERLRGALAQREATLELLPLLAAPLRRSLANEDSLREVLQRGARPERQLAAQLLLAGGDSGLTEEVLARYLAGELGDAPPLGLALSARRARELSERAATERDGATQRRLLHALGAAQQSAAIPGLLALFQHGEEPIRAQARELLRAQPTTRLWSHVEPLLRSGFWALLAVLPEGCNADALLWRLWPQADVEGQRALLARWAAGSRREALTAPGLAEEIQRRWHGGEEVALLCRVVARLSDFHNAQRAQALADFLLAQQRQGRAGPGGARRSLGAALTDAILCGIARQPPRWQVEFLSRWQEGAGDAAEEALRQHLRGLVVAEPALARALAAAERARVHSSLLKDLTRRRPPEGRRVLRFLVESAARDIDTVLRSLLVQGPGWARSLAHRLLASRLPREEYLEASRALLRDKRVDVRVRGVRVLCFGHHLPVLPELITLLLDPERRVARAAERGMLVLGGDVLPALKHALARARPDQRRPLRRVLHALQHATPEAVHQPRAATTAG